MVIFDSYQNTTILDKKLTFSILTYQEILTLELRDFFV